LIILRFAVLGVVFLGRAAAQDYCSLVVDVTDSGDRPLTHVPVTVEEADGRTESSPTEKGEARFCDLGISQVTVSVGSPSDCTYAVVRNVPLLWSATRRIKVVYDNGICAVDEPPPILLCAVLLRFRGQNGNWISGVKFDPPLPRFLDLRSDSSGRAMIRLANREELHTATRKDGYISRGIDLSCSGNLTERERIVTLQKAP
jgi:hypothetical protein